MFGLRIPFQNLKSRKHEVYVYVASLSSLSIASITEPLLDFHECEPVYSRCTIHTKLA